MPGEARARVSRFLPFGRLRRSGHRALALRRHSATLRPDTSRLRAYAAEACRLGEAAMTQDVLGALWFIALFIIVYGVAIGDLCLWRRDDRSRL